MIYNKKFIFAHLEKTGGTFIEQFIKRTINDYYRIEKLGNFYENYVGKDKRYINPNVGIDNCRHDALYRYIPDNLNLVKFGYIRNPYDWYLSFWCFSKKGHSTYDLLYLNDESKKDINEFIKTLYTLNFSICYYSNSLVDEKEYTLPHINFSLMKKLDIGLLTYRYLYIYYHPDVFEDIDNYKKYFLADKILRFEDLHNEFISMFKKFDLGYEFNKKAINHFKSRDKIRATKHRHYTDNYYTQETIDLIKYKDRIIFKEYNYEF